MNAKPVFSRFARAYVPGHIGAYSLGLFFLLATTVVTITIPKVIGQVIDQLQLPDATIETLRPTILWLMLLALLLFVFRTSSRIAIFYPGRKIEQDIRQAFFNRVTEIPVQYGARHTVGDIMSRGVNDVSAIRVMVSMGFLHVINTIAMGAGAVHGMISLSARLTAWVVMPLIAMFLTTAGAVRFIYSYVRQGQEALGELSESVRETLGAYPVLNTTPVREQFLRRFDLRNERYSIVIQQLAAARAVLFPLLSTFVGAGILLVLWQGGGMVIAGDLALGTLVAFIAYVWILSDPAVAIGWVINALQRGYSALVRIYQILDMPIPTQDAPITERFPKKARTLQVRNLCFKYPSTANGPDGKSFELVIDRLDLRSGMRLGIFGPTGSGKTTLAHLLSGVLDPPYGTIGINGYDQRRLPASVWRRWVSYVPQQSLLFSTSIADNIRMASRHDTARLTDAVAFACLGAEVANFPQGLETRVGEAGIALSGGQRQRVSLARAFYHGGGLLILDDVTSAVDLVTEARLLEHIREHLSACMLIMISHRVGALRECDEILLLEHGSIIDRGGHDELCRRNTAYRATWDYEQRVCIERRIFHRPTRERPSVRVGEDT